MGLIAKLANFPRFVNLSDINNVIFAMFTASSHKFGDLPFVDSYPSVIIATSYSNLENKQPPCGTP